MKQQLLRVFLKELKQQLGTPKNLAINMAEGMGLYVTLETYKNGYEWTGIFMGIILLLVIYSDGKFDWTSRD